MSYSPEQGQPLGAPRFWEFPSSLCKRALANPGASLMPAVTSAAS